MAPFARPTRPLIGSAQLGCADRMHQAPRVVEKMVRLVTHRLERDCLPYLSERLILEEWIDNRAR